MSREPHELLTWVPKKWEIYRLTTHRIHSELFSELFTALRVLFTCTKRHKEWKRVTKVNKERDQSVSKRNKEKGERQREQKKDQKDKGWTKETKTTKRAKGGKGMQRVIKGDQTETKKTKRQAKWTKQDKGNKWWQRQQRVNKGNKGWTREERKMKRDKKRQVVTIESKENKGITSSSWQVEEMTGDKWSQWMLFVILALVKSLFVFKLVSCHLQNFNQWWLCFVTFSEALTFTTVLNSLL